MVDNWTLRPKLVLPEWNDVEVVFILDSYDNVYHILTLAIKRLTKFDHTCKKTTPQ